MFFSKMNNGYNLVSLLTENELNKIKKNIIILNSTIQDKEKLEEYWQLQNKRILDKKLISLYSNTKLTYRVSKIVSRFVNIKKSNYKLKTMVNTLRCDSHRNRITDIIDNELEKVK